MSAVNYEIIATLGPACAAAETWQAMLSAGATAFRLNTSHLSLDQLQRWLERWANFTSANTDNLSLVLDLQGSKWRVGQFAPFVLSEGQNLELVLGGVSEQPNVLPVPHTDFFRAAPLSNAEIVMNDAKIRLKMEAAGADWVRARVVRGGEISAHKGITFTASDYRSESLSDKDQAIFSLTKRLPSVRYALSYVKDAAEMERYRALLGNSAYLIAKLERGPAMQEAEEIARNVQELWVCRGDLGAELGLREMAEAVYWFSQHVRTLPVLSIMAGQVLEHMTASPTPTRSEICYLQSALADGYRGFVLSDETAIGSHPVESCQAAALFKNVA